MLFAMYSTNLLTPFYSKWVLTQKLIKIIYYDINIDIML